MPSQQYKPKNGAEAPFFHPDAREIETGRLLLRPFSEGDLGALFEIFSDEEVNRFLPWFPLKTAEEARVFYNERFAPGAEGLGYAVCLKADNVPIGYVTVSASASRDLGYGLRREFQRRGIATEAAAAVIGRLRRLGVPYVTATHDVNNPRSGAVMRRLGMKYLYSYEEFWQPKGFPVVFRLYQLNLDGDKDRAYMEYWDNSAVHFIESPGAEG